MESGILYWLWEGINSLAPWVAIAIAGWGAYAAARAARASEQATLMADRHFRQQLRPHVGVERFTFSLEEGRFQFAVRNYGQTPADVRIETQHKSAAGESITINHDIGIIDPGAAPYGMFKEQVELRHGWRVDIKINYSDMYGSKWQRSAEYYLTDVAASDEAYLLAIVGGSSKEVPLRSSRR